MSEQHDLTGNIIVLDNHRAHLSHRVIELMEELHCYLYYLPPASSFLNPIETFWAQVKRIWRRELIVSDVNVHGQDWMNNKLTQICQSFNEQELDNLSRAHHKEVFRVLQEAA